MVFELKIITDVYSIIRKPNKNFKNITIDEYLDMSKPLYAFRAEMTAEPDDKIVITDLVHFFVFWEANEYYDLVRPFPMAILPTTLAHKNFDDFTVVYGS